MGNTVHLDVKLMFAIALVWCSSAAAYSSFEQPDWYFGQPFRSSRMRSSRASDTMTGYDFGMATGDDSRQQPEQFYPDYSDGVGPERPAPVQQVYAPEPSTSIRRQDTAVYAQEPSTSDRRQDIPGFQIPFNSDFSFNEFSSPFGGQEGFQQFLSGISNGNINTQESFSQPQFNPPTQTAFKREVKNPAEARHETASANPENLFTSRQFNFETPELSVGDDWPFATGRSGLSDVGFSSAGGFGSEGAGRQRGASYARAGQQQYRQLEPSRVSSQHSARQLDRFSTEFQRPQPVYIPAEKKIERQSEELVYPTRQSYSSEIRKKYQPIYKPPTKKPVYPNLSQKKKTPSFFKNEKPELNVDLEKDQEEISQMFADSKFTDEDFSFDFDIKKEDADLIPHAGTPSQPQPQQQQQPPSSIPPARVVSRPTTPVEIKPSEFSANFPSPPASFAAEFKRNVAPLKESSNNRFNGPLRPKNPSGQNFRYGQTRRPLAGSSQQQSVRPVRQPAIPTATPGYQDLPSFPQSAFEFGFKKNPEQEKPVTSIPNAVKSEYAVPVIAPQPSRQRIPQNQQQQQQQQKPSAPGKIGEFSPPTVVERFNTPLVEPSVSFNSQPASLPAGQLSGDRQRQPPSEAPSAVNGAFPVGVRDNEPKMKELKEQNPPELIVESREQPLNQEQVLAARQKIDPQLKYDKPVVEIQKAVAAADNERHQEPLRGPVERTRGQHQQAPLRREQLDSYTAPAPPPGPHQGHPLPHHQSQDILGGQKLSHHKQQLQDLPPPVVLNQQRKQTKGPSGSLLLRKPQKTQKLKKPVEPTKKPILPPAPEPAQQRKYEQINFRKPIVAPDFDGKPAPIIRIKPPVSKEAKKETQASERSDFQPSSQEPGRLQVVEVSRHTQTPVFDNEQEIITLSPSVKRFHSADGDSFSVDVSAKFNSSPNTKKKPKIAKRRGLLQFPKLSLPFSLNGSS